MYGWFLKGTMHFDRDCIHICFAHARLSNDATTMKMSLAKGVVLIHLEFPADNGYVLHHSRSHVQARDQV